MARFIFKKIKLRPPPPKPVREKVNLAETQRKALAAHGKSLKFKTSILVKVPGRVANVIKAPPKPKIAQRAAGRSTDISVKLANRQRYRDNAGVVMDSCLDNLAHLDEFASMHTVTFPNGKVRGIPAFTLTALGGPLKTSGATVTRWVKRGMLPEPVLETSRGKVYHIEEVRSFVRVIGKHQEEFRQYRDEHEDIKDAIFSASSTIRGGLFSTK